MVKETQRKVTIKELRRVVDVNADAREYFYSKADERWLDWLWKNGFLDAIKQKAEDPAQPRYGTPGLSYLERMARLVPSKVVDIMLEVPITEETHNPEIIYELLRICTVLPAEQLARVVPKIRDEKWVRLTGMVNPWGFEYGEMLKVLADAGDYKGVLALAEAVLAVRPEGDVENASSNTAAHSRFYFDDLSHTKVLEHLVHVGDDHAEEALALTTKVLTKIALSVRKAESGEVFPVEDTFDLLDVDFFTLKLGQKEHSPYRDNIHDLAAVVKTLLYRLIGERCADIATVRSIYTEFIEPLPQSREMWRLRLFVWSLCCDVFADELKSAFFKLFDVERYYYIISGAEYEKALQKGFPTLSEEDRREYVEQVIERFGELAKAEEDRIYGSNILSMIADSLTEEEKRRSNQAGLALNPEYKPQPGIGPVRTGFIRPRGPVTGDEFAKLSLAEIAQNLRSDWSPEGLCKQDTGDDFFRPLNAEGVDELLRTDMASRLQDYVQNAALFFDRGMLNHHYTYSFLRGIREVLHAGKMDTASTDWEDLISLLVTIKESGESEPFGQEKEERRSFRAWLAGWDAVHSAMADVILQLVSGKDGVIRIDFPKYRQRLFSVISYLLLYPDPTPEDEKIESAVMTTKPSGRDEYIVSNPYTMAINTVRGQAFQTFVSFVYRDGRKPAGGGKPSVSADTKELYEKVLRSENTRALMFMFGRYLSTFYFRDRSWIRGLLPLVFPEEPEKKHLYTAAWEGYLSSSLYKEMFFDPDVQSLYLRGLALTDTDYPKQKHFLEPDEGVASHFALAFMYSEDFGFDHPLFDAFWLSSNEELHVGFVSFLGRTFVAGRNADADELLEKEPRGKQQLKNMWDWVLRKCQSPRVFNAFAFWISLEKGIFEPAWLAERVKKTLEKTKGVLNWDYGLLKSIIQIAEEAPEDTLAILRLYLLEGGVRGPNRHVPLYVDNEWFDALKILHANAASRPGTISLIDDLIREGGRAFWGLKEILVSD